MSSEIQTQYNLPVMKKIIITTFLAALFLIPEVKATELPSNWSIDLKSGITTGSFTFNSKTSAQGGFNVRYSMSPVVSFYGDMGFGQFRSQDSMQGRNGFENDYFTIGVGARMNILRMLAGPNTVTSRFGIYASTGLGLMRGDLDVSNTRLPGYRGRDSKVNAVVFRLATGASYRITRRVDFFLQAQFNHSDSDFLDGYERIDGGSTGRFTGGDSFLNTSAGVTIKFGRSNVRHADWYQRDHRSDPIAHSLHADLARLQAGLEQTEHEQEQLGERLQSLNQTINEFSHLINTANKDQFKLYDNQMESMQNRLDLMQSDINDITELAEMRREERTENQFFVVAAVFSNMDRAERALRQIENAGFDQASIERDRRRNYYLVNYSGHTTREEALQEMQRIRAEVNPESWVYVK